MAAQKGLLPYPAHQVANDRAERAKARRNCRECGLCGMCVLPRNDGRELLALRASPVHPDRWSHPLLKWATPLSPETLAENPPPKRTPRKKPSAAKREATTATAHRSQRKSQGAGGRGAEVRL